MEIEVVIDDEFKVVAFFGEHEQVHAALQFFGAHEIGNTVFVDHGSIAKVFPTNVVVGQVNGITGVDVGDFGRGFGWGDGFDFESNAIVARFATIPSGCIFDVGVIAKHVGFYWRCARVRGEFEFGLKLRVECFFGLVVDLGYNVLVVGRINCIGVYNHRFCGGSF